MAVKPEMLSPAGDRERLDMALAYGADAVYLAGSAFGMRAFAGNFDLCYICQHIVNVEKVFFDPG